MMIFASTDRLATMASPDISGEPALIAGPLAPFDLTGSEESLHRLREYTAQYGDFFRVYSPQRQSFTYVLNNPAGIKRVLLTNHANYIKGIGTDQITILLGRGIMTSNGEHWRRQRRMLQPAFHRGTIAGFGTTIAAITRRHADLWAKEARCGQPVNITEAASELTLEINLAAIFGEDLPRILARLGRNPFAVVHTEGARDLKFAYQVRSLAPLVRNLIARRQAAPSGTPTDFFGMALAARDKPSGAAMDDRQLIDEVLTLIVAGHETTAATLAWSWYHLGRHPEIQELLAGSARILPEEKLFDFDTIQSWHAGQQVLKEVLRLSPPGWILSRRTVKPDKLLGVPLPAGTDVLISPYFLHRHPRYWSEPERFDPSRFSDAASAERERFAYIPFGVGPRHCIGEGLATFEIAAHLAYMTRRFRLTPADEAPPQIEARINYRLRSELPMSVELR